VTGGSQNGTTKTGSGRPKHPVFSRANTTSTTDLRGQTHKDAIDVEKTTSPVKAGPKKLVFASDTKPAHSFFARPTPITSAAPSEIPEPPNTNGTVPIPEPTPAEVVAPILPPKKVHNFFQPARSDAKTTTMKNGWGHGIKEGEEWLPPWPGGDWPVHSGVVDTSCQAGPSRPRRPIPEAKACDPDQGFWQSFLTQAEGSDDSNKHTHRRAKNVLPVNSDRESYCDRFRPRTAAQVLGNATEATYLRDWLSTLVVGNKDGSGPRVIRKVPKRKMRLDDWIVDDIGEFGDEEPEAELEMPEPYDEPDLPMGERPNTYAPLSAWLTNTILLSGPIGSGKSAAVYAAATELGWEVFEVYPGIGKRTGGNLMCLVGDVGKNHMVGKAKEAENTKPSPAGLKTFFGSNIKEVDIEEGPPTGSQGEPIEIDDDHPERSATPPPRLRNPSIPTTPFRDEAKFRQSLILLEEVDILFDEEATFWPAVIALIAESKRPVVMTCNGMSSLRPTLTNRSRTCDVGCAPITGDPAVQTTTKRYGNCTPRLALCSTRPRP
jgi:DNA polymerase III delta prime subunit